MLQINDNIEDKLRSQDLPKNAIIYEHLMLNNKYISLFEKCCEFICDNAEKGINLEYLDQLIGPKSLDLDKYLEMLTTDQKSLPFLVKELCQPLESFFSLEPHIIFPDSSHERKFDEYEQDDIDNLLDSFNSLKDITQLKQEDLANLSFLSYIKEERDSSFLILIYSMQNLAKSENVNIEQKTMLTNLSNKFHFVESIISDVYHSKANAEKIKISQILYKNIDILNFLLNGKNDNSETMIKDICDSNTDKHKQIDNFMQDFYNNFKDKIERLYGKVSYADKTVWKKEEENYQLQLNKSLSQRTSTLAPKSAPAPIVPAAPVEPAASAQAPKTVVSTAKPAPVQAPKSAPAPIVPAAPVEPAVPALKPVVSTAKPAPVPATKPVVSTAKSTPAPAPRTDPAAPAISPSMLNRIITRSKGFFDRALDDKKLMKKIHILEYKNNTIQQTKIKLDDLKDFQNQDKYFTLKMKVDGEDESKEIAINFKENKVLYYNEQKAELLKELSRIQRKEHLDSLKPTPKPKSAPNQNQQLQLQNQ